MKLVDFVEALEAAASKYMVPLRILVRTVLEVSGTVILLRTRIYMRRQVRQEMLLLLKSSLTVSYTHLTLPTTPYV